MRITEVDNEISSAELDNVERFADKMFGKIGIDVEFTRHFLDRVNDERNVKPITVSELIRIFKQEYKRWGNPIKKLGPDAEAVMKDMKTDINIPFALRWDPRNQELDLIAKTVMRKKDFRTPNQEFPVESKKLATPVANEGGAMSGAEKSHPTTLKESGSAPGVGSIHRDEIEPTLGPISKLLGVNLVNQALGSVGKKQFSGDIDVALNITPDQTDEFTKTLEKNSNVFLYVEKTSVWITKIKIQNYDAKRPFIDPETGKNMGPPEGRTGFVQLDFMPGDPGWLKTYYHSPTEEESKYKGVFRNLMIGAIAGVFDRQDSQEKIEDGRPKESRRWMWSPRDGLIKVQRTPTPNKAGTGYTKQNTNKIIQGPFKTADEIANTLNVEPKDLNSFETLLDAIKAKYDPSIVQRIIDNFKTNKTVKDIGVPSELES